ncbi:NAD-dependent succinate-semialdehyde dehydrogenase [Alkalihalobacillus sp. AL-G]|uniref:NAD-dependent succinate-semialdehyde dehydrogenase n=1 Tax=Alkalihalobacillus sp. AL-G TaxID=2926399 RepID=UPI0027296E6A|nr:NAD-dependent succinate-semialdehyde dehydrogenase [Alkalihalobacillus sp. AL-G]WLD94847.1 NAD-dependent succinate-semialdehyde dehydrogenase [Alkalihalobacillus sp. AL-G]
MEKGIYVNGEWTGKDLEKVEVINPATGELVGTVPKAGKKETRNAIEAANEAFKTWSKTTAYERAEYLEKFYELVIKHEDELAEIMTLEMGKPLKESKGEAQYAASFLKWFAEEGKRIYGRTIPPSKHNKRMQVNKQPVGVVGAITPWNFPAAMITRKLAPALAAGCTIVIKPPNETPLTAVRLIELCEEAGIPKGVVNLVTGKSSEIGEEIMSNPRVKKLTFTGSTEVGKILMKQAAENVMKISLELGGHAPIVVLDDADIDLAAQQTVASKFRNGGQTCISGNRVYVQEKVYDAFIEKVVAAAEKLRIGNGMEEGVDVGPLINKDGYEKVEKHVKNAVKRGAKCVLGGKGKEGENGTYYYHPTVLIDVKPDMLIMNEETFGPIVPIQKVSTDEETINYANSTPFGLAAYVFSENYSRGLRVAEALDYGIVGWNDGLPSAAQAPFGGMKQSGMGREGGKEGIEEYLETKYISIGLKE